MLNFAAAYTVEDSENSQKIKEAKFEAGSGLQNRVNALLAAARSNKLGHDVFEIVCLCCSKIIRMM